jgi:hypothetical protein
MNRISLFQVKITPAPGELLLKAIRYWRQNSNENWGDILDTEIKNFISSHHDPVKIWELIKAEKFL